MVSALEGCSEGCGIAAAILAVLMFGTFGVPIKCNVNVEVNFFVMQSYKTIVCFLTSWFVIFLGEPIRWSSWGIVSGLFWVPGASCGIYAIRNAGVAVAVGTWASIQVITSCIFGILIFRESVKDTRHTIMAIMTLMVGLVGMSRYSDSSAAGSSTTNSDGGGGRADPSKDVPSHSKMTPLEIESSEEVLPLVDSPENEFFVEKEGDRKERMIRLLNGRLVMTQRQLGLLGAIVNGAWGGLNLIPLHYAKRDSGMSGASYLISYSTGSLIVCVGIWAGLFLYQYVNNQHNVKEALAHLPAFHVRELGIPGMLAGLFYSMGNFCSILAVEYLGQGVGFSFCQGQLLVSGLWGVFYFKEIQGRETIIKWFSSAIVTVIGIIWLSSQHETSASSEN